MPPLTRFALTFILSSLGTADGGPVYLVIDSQGHHRTYTDRLHFYPSHQQRMPYRIQTTDLRGGGSQNCFDEINLPGSDHRNRWTKRPGFGAADRYGPDRV